MSSARFFGAVADVRALADVSHARGGALVADEAWGAHSGFHLGLPASALAQAAALVACQHAQVRRKPTSLLCCTSGAGPSRNGARRTSTALADRCSPLPRARCSCCRWTPCSSIAVQGGERMGRSLRAAAGLREGVHAGWRFRDLSERFLAAPAVVAVDPLRIVIDWRSGGISGHEARPILFDRHQVRCTPRWRPKA
jgi:lysine decarboxylase